MATKIFGQVIESAKIQEIQPLSINMAVNSRSVETMLNISPQIQEVFNRNEILLNNDIATITPAQFGVLGHIDPTRNMLVDAIHGIDDLRSQLTGENAIIAKAKILLSEIKKRNDVEDLGINDDYWSRFNKKDTVLSTINFQEKEGTVIKDKTISLKNVSELTQLDSKTDLAPSLFSSGLFSAGNTVRAEIKDVDNLHSVLMNMQAQLSRALVRKNNELVKLDNDIPVQQRNLANLNQARLQSLAEYKMVLGLVEENWIKVEQDYVKREKILTNHRGIYYARVNETPWAQSSLADMPLRYGQLEDLVPGIALSHDELPDDIEPYIEAIVDMPMANWKIFNDTWNSLPSRNTILNLMANRKLRLQYKSQQSRTASSSKFLQTLQTHQSIMQDYSRFSFIAESSLQAFYKQAVNIISLEDLLSGTPHQLRGVAQEFRNKLDQATHSVLSILHSIKPSIRLDWATAAELDQLDLKNPQAWPGMNQAAVEDINSIRTLIELINWWWRQLNENATTASVTAVRNLLRAALMVAVGDDPKEMIHGQLQIIPNIFNVGDFLRATLNRHAPIGTILHLVNEKDELVGKLRVEDADENGSVVSIAQMFQSETKSANSQYSVIGMKNTTRSFV